MAPSVMLTPVPLTHRLAVAGSGMLKHAHAHKHEHHAYRHREEQAPAADLRSLRQRPMTTEIPIMPTHPLIIQQR